MIAYPPRLTLPYRVGARWLERRTLAGELVEPLHTLTIDCDLLDASAQHRAAALAKRISVPERDAPVTVVGSGLDETMVAKGKPVRILRATDPIVAKIGPRPELPEPTDDPLALIAAYEAWVADYLALSRGAFAEWVLRRAEGRAEGDPWREAMIVYRVGRRRIAVEIDGRAEPEALRRHLGAVQATAHARAVADEQDWTLAAQVVGSLTLDAPADDAMTVIEAAEQRARRASDFLFARHWARERARDGFDREMRRWARARGSARLQIGVDDGYRMMPVYLAERMAAEAPGFYAHLPSGDDDPHTWQPRTGPSEEALRLRRAVQQRLERDTPPGTPVPEAEIGWMKAPPRAMCHEPFCFKNPLRGEESGVRETPFEVIGARGWLGRYTLVAGVVGEDAGPPPYLLLRYVLDPADYGLDDLVRPPTGVSLAANAMMRKADDDLSL